MRKMRLTGFIGNVLKFSIPTMVSGMVALVALPAVSHLVNPDDFAIINIFYDLGMLIALFAPLGLSEAYLRYYLVQESQNSRARLFTIAFITEAVVIAILAAIVIGFAGGSFSRYIFGKDSIQMLFMLFIYAFAICCYKLTGYGLRLDGDARLYNTQQSAFIISNRLLFVVPVALIGGYEIGCITLVVCTIAIAVASVAAKKKPRFCIAAKDGDLKIRKLFAYGLPLVLTSISLNLISSLNKTALVASSSTTEAGVFSLGMSIANLASFVSAAFCTYWSVYIYENYKTKRTQIALVHDFVSLAALLFVLVVFALQDILFLFIGDGYSASQSFFMLIMLWPLQSLLGETTSYGINLSGKTYLMLICSVASIAIDAVSCILLVPEYGAFGASLAFAFAAIINLSLKSLFGQLLYRTINYPVRTVAIYLLIIFICCINSFLWKDYCIRIIISVILCLFGVVLYRKQLFEFAAIFRRFLSKK